MWFVEIVFKSCALDAPWYLIVGFIVCLGAAGLMLKG
jgi:hypothetical protein